MSCRVMSAYTCNPLVAPTSARHVGAKASSLRGRAPILEAAPNIIYIDWNKIVWRKSTYSNVNGSCVEVDLETEPGIIRVRDSKFGDQSYILRFTQPEWDAFVAGIKEGQLQ